MEYFPHAERKKKICAHDWIYVFFVEKRKTGVTDGRGSHFSHCSQHASLKIKMNEWEEQRQVRLSARGSQCSARLIAGEERDALAHTDLI
jgi:hypothetical protein